MNTELRLNSFRKTTTALVATAGLLLTIGAAQAQEETHARQIYPLAGQHQLTLTAGSLVGSDYNDDQNVGSFEYSYWMSDTAAFTISMAGISSDDSHHHYDDDEGVGIVAVGMQLRPEFFNISDRVFFTLQGQVGPYVGVSYDGYTDWEDGNDHHYHHWNRDEETETQWGAYVGLNLNIAVTRRFLIGTSVGYHFVEKFDTPVNGETDFNSADFRLRFSFVL